MNAKQQIEELNPCADGLDFAKSCDYDLVKIWNTCERGDWMIWLLRATHNINKVQSVQIACACAEHVLEIFEKKYPNDKRSRLAIEAALNWVKNPTEENRIACDLARKNARYAANAAAYAAAAAAAAAAADADAAYAADAADAAADAADAAAADAADARKMERKWQADKIREIIPCPF